MMEIPDLKFNPSCHSNNAQVYNDSTSVQEQAFGSRVLQTRPPLVPGLIYKLIVEGKGKVGIFVTQDTGSFVPQTRITLDKDTYHTHVYRVYIHDDMSMSDRNANDACAKESMYSESSGNYTLCLEEESKPGGVQTKRLRAAENDTEKPWLLILNVEGDISLITIVTEDGAKEDQLTFIDDIEGCQMKLFNADKSTFRRNIDAMSVCFGNRLLKSNEQIKLKVTRTNKDGVCEIGTMSDELFRRMTSLRKGFGYKEVSKHLTKPVLRNNVLHEPTTSQITVTVPMVASGVPVFMFSGCTLDLCTDIPSPSLSEETCLKTTNETTCGLGEQLQQVQKTLESLELKMSQKENNDNEHNVKILDQMMAAQHEARVHSSSLSELRIQHCEMITDIKGTRETVKKTNDHVKTIVSRINKGSKSTKTTVREDRSLEMLNKYINPNYARILNSLNENDLIDYLFQYEVLTEQQHEEIRKQNAGAERRRHLLDVLKKKPVSHLPKVKESLAKSGNTHLIPYFEDRQ